MIRMVILFVCGEGRAGRCEVVGSVVGRIRPRPISKGMGPSGEKETGPSLNSPGSPRALGGMGVGWVRF